MAVAWMRDGGGNHNGNTNETTTSGGKYSSQNQNDSSSSSSSKYNNSSSSNKHESNGNNGMNGDSIILHTSENGSPGYLESTYAPKQNHNVSPSSSTAARTNTSMQDVNMRIVGALIGMIVLLVILFAYIIAPYIRMLIRRILYGTGIYDKYYNNPKRIERRYVTIEGWLISKRVRKHDSTCANRHKTVMKQNENVLKEEEVENPKLADDKQESVEVTTSHDLTLDCCFSSSSCHHECPICMAPMVANEIVSWSPNQQGTCNHVYHHECIKEWLLHHINCPFCRETFLLCDEQPKKALTRQRYNELAEIRRQRLLTTCYCEEEGFIVIPEYGNSDQTQKQSAKEECDTTNNYSKKSTNNKNNGNSKDTSSDLSKPAKTYRSHSAKKRNPLVASGVKKGELALIRGSRVDLQQQQHESTSPSDGENEGGCSVMTDACSDTSVAATAGARAAAASGVRIVCSSPHSNAHHLHHCSPLRESGVVNQTENGENDDEDPIPQILNPTFSYDAADLEGTTRNHDDDEDDYFQRTKTEAIEMISIVDIPHGDTRNCSSSEEEESERGEQLNGEDQVHLSSSLRINHDSVYLDCECGDDDGDHPGSRASVASIMRVPSSTS